VDTDGRPRAQIRYGDAGRRLLDGQRAAVRALLDTGNDIVLDEMPVDRTILPAWRQELSRYRIWWVRLVAPLAVVEEREAHRTHGRHVGHARGHLDVADGEPFDLTVDTSALSPAETAETILAAFDLASAPAAPEPSTPGTAPA
jgi:chloramphenicol 3-O phosphotransferase